MASTTNSHPRRTPAQNPNPDALLDAFRSMSLRKGDTDHVPTLTNNEVFDGIDGARNGSPSNPLRSTTCPNTLEEMLIGSGERRAADLLNRVDKAIATQSKLALSNVLSDPEVLPVPKSEQDDEDSDAKTTTRSPRRSHSSDSGIGSSVESISGKSTRTVGPSTEAPGEDDSSTVSVDDDERGLSEYAKDQIHKHIVKPILREQSLKEFHSLIKEVPRRIGNKEINTLRELERALIFLAPEYTPSPRKYLDFCERTIRVLHTTVTTLHESDQRAPTDRPYTQGYFVDLVEQIRRYALILAATREKQAKEEKLDEMDYSPDESITIHGGVSHNGKQAELVRHKDGKLISVATGEVLSSEDIASASMKRPVVEDENDEVLRSMARRKKNAKPEVHGCDLCDKEFKRPCDLTKHVKTHERPWKCSDTTCKYHALGWPTEKERDRHENDKHSAQPSLYQCLFKPCPYTSKRESNCKQHMEKAHGWEYVRSKNNGKSRASDAIRLPQGSIPPSPASSMLTPLTPIAPSPSVQSWSTSSHRDSMPPPSLAGPSNYGTPAAYPSSDFSGHFNYNNFGNFDFNDISDNFTSTSAFPMTPMSEDRRTSMSVASSHGLMLDGSVYNDAITPDDLNMEASFSFDAPLFPQQPTPNSNLGLSSGMDYKDYSTDSAGPSSAYMSPHANVDFISPHPTYEDNMQIGDEALVAAERPHQDFTLFGSGSAQAASGAEMFPSLSEGNGWNNLGGQFGFNAQLKSDSSALNELFPELTNHM